VRGVLVVNVVGAIPCVIVSVARRRGSIGLIPWVVSVSVNVTSIIVTSIIVLIYLPIVSVLAMIEFSSIPSHQPTSTTS